MTAHDPTHDLRFEPMLSLLAQLPDSARESMVRMYRKSLADHLAQIEAGLSGPADAGELAGAVHKIAGSSGMMQDQVLAQAARAMELALREGGAEEARSCWPRVRESVERTRQALDEVYPVG